MTWNGAAVIWRQFVMNLGSLDPDAVEMLFERYGAHAVTLTDAGKNPLLEPAPGETPLWADVQITGLFSADADLQALRGSLVAEFDLESLPAHRTEDLPDRDWEREWLRDFGPMQFGRRLWVCPTGSIVEQSDAVIVHLDPGLAFGTGTHATTALCLEWLDAAGLEGKTMLDYGCGSGILAIAALKLGCRSATAMDIDPQAVVATRRNSEDNAVARQLYVTADAGGIDGVFDFVAANILAGPLVQYAESITSTLAGRGMLVLSGVLCEQADEVMAAYMPWIEFDRPVFREQDGQIWSRLTGRRRAG